VRLAHLSLAGFRNYAELELAFDAGHHLLIGPNGSGKTNILEAIHVLGTGASQRASRDSEMIAHGAPGFRTGARFESEDGTALRAEVILDAGARKRILVDREPTRAATLLRNVKVVSFAPSDVRLVQDAAEERRRLLDLIGGQLSAEYSQLLREYQRAVRQRNETLAKPFLQARGRVEARRVREPWDDLVVELGSRLLIRRDELVRELGEALERLSGEAFRRAGRLEAEYVPGLRWTGPDPRPAFREALARTLEKDEILGRTGAGPHRDDVDLRLGGRALRNFGSLGQQHLGAMFLKLSQAELVRTRAGVPPLLLVDEMFAVLDRRAAEGFLARVEGEGQIFLATAQEGWLGELRERRFEVHRVESGRVGAQPAGARGTA
jgi:DNA replication and repair protein RecF